MQINARRADKFECHECGHQHEHDLSRITSKVRCAHCEAVLHDHSHRWLDKTLALTIAAIIFFIVSNLFPFLLVELGGVSYQTNLLSGVSAMLVREQYLLGTLILSTIVIFPLLEILSLSYLSFTYALRKKMPGQKFVLGLLTTLRPWSMLEIFLLSIVIALVKMNDFFTLAPGPALFAFFALVFCMVGANRCLNKRELWDWLCPENIFYSDNPKNFAACKQCEALMGTELLQHNNRCCRCHKPVHERKPMSVQNTLALTTAAAVLYIPANTFPMLHSTRLGSTQGDTIISGVLHLFESGMWVLALIVFFASVFVPILKIVTMAILLYSVKVKSIQNLKRKTVLYRTIETIGRWSMIDVFVVILLVALVQFGVLANVEAGVAVIAFSAVVILTMLATEAFDSRLLWDAKR